MVSINRPQRGILPQRRPTDSSVGGGGFNNLAAGNKHYGAGGRPNPNQGATGAVGQLGYAQRDGQIAARRDALLRRVQGGHF